MRVTGSGVSLLFTAWLLIVTEAIAGSIITRDIEHIHDLTGGGAAGPLSLPSDVAVYNHRVYVVDGGNHRVVVFDDNGDYQFTIGVEGEHTGQFRDPVGIDAGPDGKIYVADKGNQRIQIFNADGRYLDSFQVISNGKLVHPVDVAVDDEDNEIFVTGNDNHRVMVFSLDGRLQRQWGGSGLSQGEFRYPGTITFLQDMRVAVVDILNTRVQVFDQSGEFSLEIGEWGVLAGQLFRPKGIVTDSSGRVYVSDSYLNLIQVYSDTGMFLYVLSVNGMTHAMESPTGLAIGDDNSLYVAEMLENKVSVFKLDL